MTKSIIISYSEADESLLMAFFKRLKVKVQKELDFTDEGVPVRVAHQMIEGLKDVERYERGEIDLLDAYDLLAELRAEQSQTVEMAMYDKSEKSTLNQKELTSLLKQLDNE